MTMNGNDDRYHIHCTVHTAGALVAGAAAAESGEGENSSIRAMQCAERVEQKEEQ